MEELELQIVVGRKLQTARSYQLVATHDAVTEVLPPPVDPKRNCTTLMGFAPPWAPAIGRFEVAAARLPTEAGLVMVQGV